MCGYLAFDQDKCIGWCNANNARQFIRLKDHLEPLIEGKKIGCVICFIVHPEYRRRGVARQLLAQAITDFKNQGYDGVLGLPVEIKDNPEKMYRGTAKMYDEQGFRLLEQHDNVSVMFLELK
ncbi:MAG: GNAT family N-acetyltransferase [Limnochordia bacterium]|nr:GNAT family N-acetyltransferase [Limnochordia bacterium]